MPLTILIRQYVGKVNPVADPELRLPFHLKLNHMNFSGYRQFVWVAAMEIHSRMTEYVIILI